MKTWGEIEKELEKQKEQRSWAQKNGDWTVFDFADASVEMLEWVLDQEEELDEN